MKTKWLNGALALSVCFGVAQVAQAQTAMDDGSSTRSAQSAWVTLRLNLKPGSRYRMTQTSQTKMVMLTPAMSGRPAEKMETSGMVTNVLDYAVLYNNPDGTMQIRLTYGAMNDNTTMKIGGKIQPMPDNSATKALLGQSIEMKLSPEGQVSDVRGLDNIWKKAFSVSNSKMPPAMQRQMESGMKKMFGDNFIKNLMQQGGMMFPENPVRIGNSWTHRIETSGQLPLVANVLRTLQSRENGALTIAENGTLSVGDPTKTVSFGPAALQMAITGTYSGTSILDEATGFTRSTSVAQRYGGTVYTKAQGKNLSMRMFGLASVRVNAEKLN